MSIDVSNAGLDELQAAKILKLPAIPAVVLPQRRVR
jgi:hypothetical protein